MADLAAGGVGQEGAHGREGLCGSGHPPAALGPSGKGDTDEPGAAGIEGGGLGIEGKGLAGLEFLTECLQGLGGIGGAVIGLDVGQCPEVAGGEQFNLCAAVFLSGGL